MYSIGTVSQMFCIPVSTLRYYDKEGLFPHITRESGIRKFSDRELEALHLIECLKRSGLEIKEIKEFMYLCSLGSETYAQRKQLFENQKAKVEQELEKLKRTQAMLEFKCWYYEKAMADGNEEQIKAMLPDKLPPDIQELYNKAHEKIQ